MSIEKYNRVSNEVKFEVTRKKISEWTPDHPYTMRHIGVYQSEKYGVSCYVDIDMNGVRVRSSLPRRMAETIDKMAHDPDVMNEIHSGQATISVHPFKTKNGFTTVDVKFADKEPQDEQLNDTDDLPVE